MGGWSALLERTGWHFGYWLALAFWSGRVSLGGSFVFDMLMSRCFRAGLVVHRFPSFAYDAGGLPGGKCSPGAGIYEYLRVVYE